MMWRGLTADARQTIRDHGISVTAYLRHHQGHTGRWGGDICGCTDDRCAGGYHHSDLNDCRCLPALLDMMTEQPRHTLWPIIPHPNQG